ncbi:MAG: hypothetical protein QM820_14970 [Minicystis sp.]
MTSRRRTLSLLAFIPLASVGLYGGACGHSDQETFEVDRVIYEGGTSDEPLLVLLSNKATATSTNGAVFDGPSVEAPLWAWEPATFSWHRDAATSSTAPARSSQRTALLDGLVGPVRAARAHGDPLNGEAHFLVFSSPTQSILGVFTTKREYTPTAEDWTVLRTAAQPLEVTILSGVFKDSELTSGPFLGQSLSFSIDK